MANIVSFATVVWARHTARFLPGEEKRRVTNPNNGCEGDYDQYRPNDFLKVLTIGIIDNIGTS